jgi:hypothetical protein
MKLSRLLMCISLLLGALAPGWAQTVTSTSSLAPANLSDFILTSTPANATGSSGISTVFSSTGTQLTLGTGGALIDPAPFTYQLTSPTTATILRPGSGGMPAATTNLVFTGRDAGTFTTVAGNDTSTGRFSLADIPNVAPIANISSRTTVGPGNAATVGFVIGGTMPRRVLVRAVGPGLVTFGIPNPLSNPLLTLYSGALPIATNRGWGTSTTSNVGVTAVIGGALGGNSTATGNTSTSGNATIPGLGATPGSVGTAPGVAGTSNGVVDGAGGAGISVAPPLTTTGTFSGTLPNGAPFSTELATAQTFTQVGAFGLEAGSRDAAFVATLPPGAYTVMVQSDPNTTTTATPSGVGAAGASTSASGGLSLGTTSAGLGFGTSGMSSSSVGPFSNGNISLGPNATATDSTALGTGTGSTQAPAAGGLLGSAALNPTGDVLVEVYFID